jgi:hypothetical protein
VRSFERISVLAALAVVPADAAPGALSYTATAADRFGRTATFSPFINLVSQITIVE